MNAPLIGSKEQWLQARLDLLKKEKEHTRQRDALAHQRQALPWVKLDKSYTFEAAHGSVSLDNLFGHHSQLIVQHFMFDPEWTAGCKSCTFMAEHMNPSAIHLAHRDTAFALVSKAPISKLLAYKKRMGWDVNWVSSFANDFNRDFFVSFTDEEIQSGVLYNFRSGVAFPSREAPGISVFAKGETGHIYHTYSVYGRGLENVMTAYDLLDLVPKGRDEGGKGAAWLRRKDEYESY